MLLGTFAGRQVTVTGQRKDSVCIQQTLETLLEGVNTEEFSLGVKEV